MKRSGLFKAVSVKFYLYRTNALKSHTKGIVLENDVERMRRMSGASNLQKATFAGGCFWCMVKPFDEQPGIHSVISGYTGGTIPNPTYKEVCSETTGHYEAVQIEYDPSIFPYEKLLEMYWQQIDPTDPGGQFYDRGHSYKTVIFYHNEEQKEMAENSKQKIIDSGTFKKPIVTQILPASTFYPAEEYHQGYYKKNPSHYNRYSQGSGRVAFIEKHWGNQNE